MKKTKTTSRKPASSAKKPVAKKTVAKKAVKKPVKKVVKPAVRKPVAKKVAAKKSVVKKVAAKKIVAKKAAPKKIAPKKVAKKAIKKVAVKKTAVKKIVKKTAVKAVKKPVKKVVAKKVVAKKAVVKKTAIKKSVAKKVAVKAAPKAIVKKVAPKTAQKSVAKTTPKSDASVKTTENTKKTLAPPKSSAVKASTAAYHITPIRAPKPVVPTLHLSNVASTEMTLPIVPPDYEPDDSEEFMNPVMKEYFRRRLVEWRDELLRESEETLNVLHEEGNMQKPDIADRASEETDLAIEFRVRDRERKLINKINDALQRIEENTYGYCDETGDPIPVKRLIAYPTVSMTVEARELHERRERTQRDTYE